MTDSKFLHELATKLETHNDLTLDEWNKFVQSNMIRNNFLPIMEHLCKLAPKKFTVDEYCDKKTEETTCVQFHIDAIDSDGIDGRVGYDMYHYPKTKAMSYELWWGGECYCHLYKPVEMMNMISILMGRAKAEGVSTYDCARKSDHLFPIT